ncbi:response regulator [Gemmiger formicilis]|uniref:response regulator transcription factor n=1 Tax=Gemmiger formicilis TaxID=745368 RepID=UPI003F9CB3AD
MAKIVVVEDDVYMREELLNLLEKSGYDTIGLSDFENAVSEIAAYFPDLILLDINLPFRSGFEICKELKAKQIGTVLVLTARDKLQDELHALDLGADDYLTKPCNMSRLLARIKNLLRRKEEQVQQGLLDGGGFLLDPNTFTIYVGNSSYLMPPNEGKILLALLKNSPKIVSKKELCIRLWGTEEFIDENALQVNFTRLRKTLREFGLEERIETVRGQGYRLKEQVRLMNKWKNTFNLLFPLTGFGLLHLCLFGLVLYIPCLVGLPGLFHKLCCLDNFCVIGRTCYSACYINQKT